MTDAPFRILAIAGSLRRKSFNRSLVRAAQGLTPDGVEMSIFDLLPVPLYNADVEAEGEPPAVRELNEGILSADALFISTPEYNTSISGVLKNAIDWASTGTNVLAGKPVAITGTSPGRFGTVRGQRDLREVLSALDCYVLPSPRLLVPNAGDLFDEEGGLTDETVRDRLRGVVEALVLWARRVQPD